MGATCRVSILSAPDTDHTFYGSSTSAYLTWDASANLLYSTGVDLQLKDSDYLVFGTGAGATGDVNITWDSTNLVMSAVADDSLWEIGDSATTQKSFDLKWYANEANGASYLYADASANLLYTTGVDLQFKDSDYLVFGSGAGATGDVQITWDATNLVVSATADDSVFEIGDSGATQKSFDLKWYANENNGASYLYADASANLIYTTGVDLQFKDSDYLVFGTGAGATGDAQIAWDGTDLDVMPTADDSVFNFGNGTLNWDVYLYAQTASTYVMWDASYDTLYFTDNAWLGFGNSSTAPDVLMYWNATLMAVVPHDDDLVWSFGVSAATQKSFDVKIYGNAANGADYFTFDAGASALLVGGDSRLDFSNATVAAANTDGGIIKAGTSGSPVTEDTADMKFVSLYFDDGATSGDARGIYNRLAITGAGGGGESLRSLTSVTDVAAASAHGAHLSLSFGTSGSVTGQGIATRSTLHMPSTALAASNVTYAALQAEIWSDSATSDPAGNLLSAIRVVNGGDATGAADVDDDCAVLEFSGWTVGDGNMIAVKAAAACPNVTHSFRVRLPDNSYCYLYAGATPLTA